MADDRYVRGADPKADQADAAERDRRRREYQRKWDAGEIGPKFFRESPEAEPLRRPSQKDHPTPSMADPEKVKRMLRGGR